MLSVILLSISTSLTVLLFYKNRALTKENERILNEASEDPKVLFLKSRYASMGETVGNIAHQWKQPLNAIGAIQNSIKAALVFQGDISKEKLLNSVETSFKLLQHLAETIDTFYSFLSQRSNENMSFNVAEELEKVRKITEYSFENSHIQLNFDLEINPTIQGNANEFTHAMLNLILNAKDALDDSTVETPLITVRVADGEQTCIITVSDNAGGIRLKPIDMVFDLHITTKESGSGLGLFMTKNIIESRFGGTISVKNNNGGACFTIALPYSEYGEHYTDVIPNREKLSLDRINQLSHKIIELEEVEKALKKWAEIFEHAQWGIVIGTVEEQTLGLMNPEFARMHGYSSEELIDKKIVTVFAPECLNDLELAIQTAHEKGYYSFESIHVRKDGSRFPVQIELIAVKNDNGSVLYRIVNVWDITEKKAAEERLLLKKFALDHIQDAVFLIDENAHFHYVNEGACSALGYTREEFEAMNVGDVDPDWPQQRWSEHWEALKNAGAMTIELRHRRKDGTIFPVEVSANYIEFGGKHYNMAIARDITERLQLEAQKDNERMRLFFERQLVGMAITSPEYGWVHTNEKLQQMLGYTHEELSLLTWTEMTYPEDLVPDIEQFEKLLRGEIEDYMLEKRFIRKDGSIVYTNLAVSCVRHDDHTVNYVLALLEDITERKAAQAALAAKEREFRSLAENIPDNIARWDSEGHYLYINPVHEQTLGRSAAEVIGNRIPDEHSAAKEAITHVYQTGESVLVHQEVVTKDGNIEYHDVNIVPERDPSGKIISVLGVGRDMTHIYRLQNELEKREKELLALAESSPGMMGAYYMRPDGSVCMLYASPNIHELFGITPDEIKEDATPLMALIHPDDYEMVVKTIQESAQNMSLWHIEYRIIHPTKGIRWMEGNTMPYPHPDGGVVWYGYVHDITERKKLETLLEQERKFLTDAQRVAHTGSWYLDIRLGSLTWSDETYRIFELDKEDVDDLHKTFYERVHPEDRERVEAPYVESLKTKLPYEVEHRIVMEDGRIKYVIERCEHHYDPNGTPLYSIGTVQDITERKQMEIQLEDAHNFLNKVIDSIPDPIFVKDREHRWVMLNEAFCTLIDRPRFMLLGQSDYDFFPKDEADVFWEKDELVFCSRDINVNEEPFTSSDGTTHYIQTVKSVFVSTDGEEHLVGVIRDITERREMEDELKKALEFNEGVIGAIPDLLFEITPEGIYVGVWAQDEAMLAAQKEIMLGKNFKELLPPDAVISALQAIKEVDEKGFSLGKTYSLDLPEGKKWFELSVAKKKSSGNYITLARDITERKELEALLEKERKFLTDAQRVAHTGSWYLDIPSGVLTWSDETYRIFELDKESVTDLHKTFYELVHPEDREMVQAPYLESLNTKLPYEVEHRIVMADGRIKYVIERCEHAYDHDGAPLYSIGTVQDITERKVQEEKLNKLYELSPLGIALTDIDGRYIEFNDAFCKICGYSLDELQELDYWTLTPIEYENQEFEQLESLKRTGRYGPYEKVYRQKNGNRIPIQLNGILVKGNNGEEYIWSIIEDITERKEAEETIKNLNTMLEKRVMERTVQLQEAVMTLHHETVERVALEERLSKLTATVPGVNYIFERTVDGIVHFTYLAPTFEELFGISTDVAMEDFSVVMQHIHSDDLEMIRQSIITTASDFTDWHEEFRILHPDKDTIWIEGHSSPERQSDGRIVWYGFFHDITERKQIEKAPKESEEAIFIVDDTSSIIYVNDAACTMLGYERDELIAMKIYEIDVYLSKEQLNAIESGTDTDKTMVFKTKHKRKDARIIDVQVTLTYFEYDGISFGVSQIKEIRDDQL